MKEDGFGLGHVKFETFLGYPWRNVQWTHLTFRTEATARERNVKVVCE